MAHIYRLRRNIVATLLFIIVSYIAVVNLPSSVVTNRENPSPTQHTSDGKMAMRALGNLAVKGRAPKTNYSRDQFGAGWGSVNGCDTRNIILNRDLQNVTLDDQCNVTGGILHDPYTGKDIPFKRGSGTSAAVQIDHVVALSDAWQTGAQQLSIGERTKLANDPLELLAVDGPANQQKSDADAASWLPPNKSFRCQYVARQIAVKQKYDLWVTKAEHDAILHVLQSCPAQTLPH